MSNYGDRLVDLGGDVWVRPAEVIALNSAIPPGAAAGPDRRKAVVVHLSSGATVTVTPELPDPRVADRVTPTAYIAELLIDRERRP